MNRISGWPRWKLVAIPVLAVLAVAGAVIATGQLASGDPTPPPPEPGMNVTPPEPPHVLPKPVPAPADATAQAPPIKVAGVDVPEPPRSDFSVVQGGYFGEAGATMGFHRGESYVLFNRTGIIESKIAPEDQDDFQPTLLALASVGE